MANDRIALYNFYRRYLWNENDFEGWQTGMVDHSRGMFEGLLSGSVLEGFDIDPLPSEMSINIGPGIASGPTGYLNVINEISELSEISPPGSEYERALVVVRPNLVNSDYIVRPTNPNDMVPLLNLQESVIELIRGNPSDTPVYPTKGVNDVILCGLRLYAGQTEITFDDIDFEVRDLPGKNSNFQQNFGNMIIDFFPIY
jgi:hypothetical protein